MLNGFDHGIIKEVCPAQVRVSCLSEVLFGHKTDLIGSRADENGHSNQPEYRNG